MVVETVEIQLYIILSRIFAMNGNREIGWYLRGTWESRERLGLLRHKCMPMGMIDPDSPQMHLHHLSLLLDIKLELYSIVIQGRDWHFFFKELHRKYFRLAGHRISVTTIQHCCCKSRYKQYVKKWASQYSDKTLLTKTGCHLTSQSWLILALWGCVQGLTQEGHQKDCSILPIYMNKKLRLNFKSTRPGRNLLIRVNVAELLFSMFSLSSQEWHLLLMNCQLSFNSSLSPVS